MRLGLLALGVVVGLSACSAAVAQTMPQVDGKRQFKFGFSLDELYDSNLSHTNPALAASRGIHPEDYTTKPSVNFDIVQPIGRQALFLQGTAGYNFHSYNKRLNREDVGLDAGGLIKVGPCQSTLTGKYSALQSDLRDLAQNLVKNTMTTEGETVGISCGQRGLTGTLVGQHDDVTNSSTQQAKADHRVNSVSGSFGYGNDSLGQLQLTGAYSKQVFPNRQTGLTTFGDGYWNEMLGISYAKSLGSKVKVSVTAGHMVLKRDSAPVGIPLKSQGLNYTVNAQYKPSNALALQVHSQRSFMPSNRPGKLYDLVTVTQVSGDYNLGTKFVISLGGEFEDITSNQDTAAPLPTPTKSRKNAEFASIRYRQSARASLLLGYRHETRTTDLPAFDYSDNQATLSLNVNF